MAAISAPKKRGPQLGDVYGRLRLLADLGMTKHVRWFFCVCECGSFIRVRGTSMTRKNTSSCGCLRKELASKYFFKHGKTGTPEHNTWLGMMRRCYDTKFPKYHHYGGRGILVDERWHEAINFIQDMGTRPPKHSLERIDVNGNYGPDNCKWATQAEQVRNRRLTIRLTIDGDTKSLFEWSDISGIPAINIRERYRRGWDAKRAVMEPLNEQNFSASNQPGKTARS